jgi:phosphoribosyl 1,2-cyclic phosphodiesterase
LKLKYYGTRGSIPVPGGDTIKYGGNTACVRIAVGSTLIILDGGSGLRVLGNELLQTEFGKGQGVAHIFFSHAHWDHINGFPFFLPAYVRGNKFFLYGSSFSGPSLRKILTHRQDDIKFPIKMKDMSSSLEFIELHEGQKVHFHNALISCIPIKHRHLHGSLSYRIEAESKKIVYISDYEHEEKLDLKLVEFAKDADLIIYDAMFRPKEYEKRRGWGHSTFVEGINITKAANVKLLHLFHHSPDHSDHVLDEIEKKAQKLFPNTYAAKEGQEIEI